MFYEKYARLCAERGLSVTGVARKLHITPNAPSAWANGATPRNSTLKRIADYFGVDVSYLHHDDESESNDDKIVENFIEEMRSKNELTDDENLMLQLFRDLTDAGMRGEIVLIDHIKPIVADLMIPVNRIGKYTSEGFRKAYNAMQEKLGIERHTVHECRHTTATILAKIGIQPAIIADIMRHSSYSQTMDYTHTHFRLSAMSCFLAECLVFPVKTLRKYALTSQYCGN